MWCDLTALILCGGLGTRLRPLLGDRPKPLAPVNGRPFLAYLLDQLVAAGVRRVVLCTGYLGAQVRVAFGPRYDSMALVYSHEAEPLGTAGAIRHALPLLQSDPVLVLNGDSYCEVNLTAFLAWHRARRGEGSLVLTYGRESACYGRVQVDDRDAVVGFEEKGHALASVASLPGWINAGIYLLAHAFVASIPTDRAVSIEREIFPTWAGRGLYGYPSRGRFLDIGTPPSYAAAQCFFAGPRPAAGAQGEPGESSWAAGGRRVALLDRDGTLNVECHYPSDPNGVQLLPGVAEGLQRLRALGLGLAVVTNQSAIGRGYMELGRLQAIHARLEALLGKSGVSLDGIYVCPHRPEEWCRCRKPEPGLVEQASARMSFDPKDAFVIGDKACDIELGRRVGATTLLVTTGYGHEALADPQVHPDFVVDSLVEAAEIIAYLTQQRLQR